VSPAVSLWQSPPQKPTLLNKELHLWRFKLNCAPQNLVTCTALLHPEEVLRAERLLDFRKKTQFIVARAYLRHILGIYLNITPVQIGFQYNKHGKPALAESQRSSLCFNLSHSGHWGVLAILKDAAVGADIELIDPDFDYIQVSVNYFKHREQQCLEQYPLARQRRGFYRLWTRKEALMKMYGTGFQRPRHAGAPVNFLRSFPITHGYLSAVAADVEINLIKRYKFSVCRCC
jgi:4'-phosphopantetheinyl transferase